jgi:hypothetical protein
VEGELTSQKSKIFPLFAMESPAADGADMVRNCSAVLNFKEKAYLKQVCKLLIFESGACVTPRK